MKIRLRDHVTMQADKMAKVLLASTPRVLVDLYCLAPGQAQKPHAHADHAAAKDRMRRPNGRPAFSAGNFRSSRHAATSTSEPLVQWGLAIPCSQWGLAIPCSTWASSGVKIRSFLVVRWDRTGARAPLAAA